MYSALLQVESLGGDKKIEGAVVVVVVVERGRSTKQTNFPKLVMT